MVTVHGRYRNVVGGGAVYGVTDGAPVVAEVPASDAAPRAMAAEQRWVDRDPVTLVYEVDTGSHGDHFAGELVAGDDRERGRRKQAGGDVEVGTADSDRADLDHDFTGVGRWIGCRCDVQVSRLFVDNGLHASDLLGGGVVAGG